MEAAGKSRRMRKMKHDDAGAREQRAFSFEVRAAGEDGTIEGYGSVFGVKDSYDDVVMPGAFGDSIKAHKAAGSMPVMLWQHDASEVIGIWTDIREDESGLYLKGQLALDTMRGREVYALLKMGALKGLSIGFVTKEAEWNKDAQVREVRSVDLWEVSVVTFPANTAAAITAVKAEAITRFSDAEKVLRDAGLSKRDACAVVAQVKRLAIREREAREVERVQAAALAALTKLSFRS